MPRPKIDPNSVYIRELRITPPDGLPITDWKITDDDFKVVIAAKEGGTDDVRLHYHVYIETFRSESWVKTWIYNIAHCYNGESGNAVFFTRKPHDNTIGYVVKHGDVVVRYGCSQTYIDEWLAKSDEYRKAKESKRKREQRLSKSFTHDVIKIVSDQLKVQDDHRTPDLAMFLILDVYREHNKMLPTRGQMESLICTVLHPYKPQLLRQYYTKSFSFY